MEMSQDGEHLPEPAYPDSITLSAGIERWQEIRDQVRVDSEPAILKALRRLLGSSKPRAKSGPQRPPHRFWVADCKHCRVRSVLGRVEPNETEKMPAAGRTLSTSCIHCGFRNEFSADDLRVEIVASAASQEDRTRMRL